MTSTALADGGAGGGTVYSGAPGRDNPTGAGGAGGNGTDPWGGGGGGGAGVTGGNGGAGGSDSRYSQGGAGGAGATSAGASGQNGGNGTDTPEECPSWEPDCEPFAKGGGGGGGGGGAHGYVGSALPSVEAIGGKGGNGGNAAPTDFRRNDGGGGGAGGYGAVVTGTGDLGTLSNDVTGGNGGNGGGGGAGGYGGSGGLGVLFTGANSKTVTIGAGVTVQGGNGGGVAGKAGAAIVGENLDLTIGGTVAGGDGGAANAISFTSSTNYLTLQAGAKLIGNIDVASTVYITQLTDITLGNRITGSGSVNINGGGKLTLTGDNSYSGGTSIDVGTVAVGSNTALGIGKVSLFSTLQAAADGLTLQNDIDLYPSGSTVDTQAHTLTLSGVLADGSIDDVKPATLFKTGSGTLILTNDSTYTGDTVVYAGKLVVNGSITSDVIVKGAGRERHIRAEHQVHDHR